MRDDSTSSPTGQRIDLLPDWISSDLLDETKAVWLSEYGEDLTTADAVGLLQTVGEVFELLYGEDGDGQEGESER